MDSCYPWHSDHGVIRRTMHAGVTSILRLLRNARPHQSPSVAVTVLTAHRHGRRTLRREIERTARQLTRALPIASAVDVHVIVQQVLGTERPLAGSYQVGQRPDGTPEILFRLALTTTGPWLDIDTILAVLAEEWIGYVTQQSEGPSVSVPVELAVARSTLGWREYVFHADGREHRRGNANNFGRAA